MFVEKVCLGSPPAKTQYTLGMLFLAARCSLGFLPGSFRQGIVIFGVDALKQKLTLGHDSSTLGLVATKHGLIESLFHEKLVFLGPSCGAARLG